MRLRQLLRELLQAIAAACDEYEAVAALGQLTRDARADSGGGTGDESRCVGARRGEAQVNDSKGEGMRELDRFSPRTGGSR